MPNMSTDRTSLHLRVQDSRPDPAGIKVYVVLQYDYLAELDELTEHRVSQACTFWNYYKEIHLRVEWDKQGHQSTEVVFHTSVGERSHAVVKADIEAKFDALRREHLARQQYYSRQMMLAYLPQRAWMLLRHASLMHPGGRKEDLYLVGGHKQCFTDQETANKAAREELEVWLLKYGTRIYANAYAADARQSLPEVLAELPANFHQQLDVVSYLAELMKLAVAALIEKRGERPQDKPQPWFYFK